MNCFVLLRDHDIGFRLSSVRNRLGQGPKSKGCYPFFQMAAMDQLMVKSKGCNLYCFFLQYSRINFTDIFSGTLARNLV